MKILEFDKKSTFGLLRNEEWNEYYFVSGLQLIKIMLCCKRIKTKIISENEFHSLKKPQKYFIRNFKLFIFIFLGGSILKRFLDTVNMYFFNDFESVNLSPVVYVTGLITIIVLTKRNESKFRDNTKKVIEVSCRKPQCNNTKKRLRKLFVFYIILNVFTIFIILRILIMNNIIIELLMCIIPTYVMLLTLQDNDFKFIHEY